MHEANLLLPQRWLPSSYFPSRPYKPRLAVTRGLFWQSGRTPSPHCDELLAAKHKPSLRQLPLPGVPKAASSSERQGQAIKSNSLGPASPQPAQAAESSKHNSQVPSSGLKTEVFSLPKPTAG